MDPNVKAVIHIRMERTRNALIKNSMECHIVENAKELRDLLSHLIKEGSHVSVGGSQTLFETGVIDLLREMDIHFNDRYDPNIKPGEMDDLHRLAFSADYLLTSSNAVTEDGLLYNVDARGNRLAPLIFGPKTVIVVVGYNKIVKDLNAAVERVRTLAAPANALRLNKETPCTNFGHCYDCKSKDSICSQYVVTSRQQQKDRVKVIIIKENYGY